MFDLSHELKLRLLDPEKTVFCEKVEPFEMVISGGKKLQVPGKRWIEAQADLSDTPDLFLECLEWLRIRNIYFSTSYTAMKIDIGPYEGLCPSSCCNESKTVNFLVDEVYPNRTNWRDWFTEGVHHAS